MSVHSAPFFDAQPTSSNAHNRLNINFVAPVSHCSVCDVDEAFSDCGSYTIFEVDGRFVGNLESRVKLVGVKLVSMKYAVDGTHKQRQIFLEVEALLDHLFRHINTPVHRAKMVFPRFVTSIPSPFYIRSVVDSFRSGAYDGKTCSGWYGDLNAMATVSPRRKVL